MSKDMNSVSFMRNLSNQYAKQSLDTATKTELDPLKTGSKMLVHKAAEVTFCLLRTQEIFKK